MQQNNPLVKALNFVTHPWRFTGRKDIMSVDLLDPGNYDRNDYNGAWFWGPNGMERFFSYSGHKSAMRAYQKCAPVPSIVNRKAQAYINGKMYVTDKDGEEVETDQAKRLRKILRQPNPLQTWKQFEAQGYIYQQLFGYCPVLVIKPVGFKENIYATAMWNIPPFMCKIEEADSLFYTTKVSDMITKITLKYKNTETVLDKENVLILRDFTPSMRSLILPESRLLALEDPISNIIGAYESRRVLINYRGALGILSPEKDQFGVAPVDPEHKADLQKDFLRYGLKSEQWKFIISSAALKWQQMGIPTKDLMLIEEVVECTKQICDQYNYPAQMLGIIDPKYDNWDAAEKGLYQNAIMPESDSNIEQWNVFFGTEEMGLLIDKDFSHVAVLQTDQVKTATARYTLNQAKEIEWKNNLITMNQWLEALGEDGIGPDGDKRISEITKDDGPLAVAIGVGGVQGLIAVITDPTMNPQAKQATIEILFGIEPADAARMVVEKETTNPPEGGGGQGQQQQQGQGAPAETTTA